MGYWISFARTGDPNGESLVEWPAYETATEYYMELGDEVRVGQHLLKKECDFFYRYNASKRAQPYLDSIRSSTTKPIALSDQESILEYLVRSYKTRITE